MNVAVLEVDLRGFQCRFGSFDLRLININGVLLRVVILLRNGVAGDNFLVARKLDLCEIERRLCLGQGCLRGIDLCLKGARIDHKQQLPTPKIFAVLKVPLDDPATDLRRHRDGLESRISADFVEVPGHILSGCSTAVTTGGGIAGAAWTLPLLQAIVASSTGAARASFALRKRTSVFSIVVAILLFMNECCGYAEAARLGAAVNCGSDPESSRRVFL